MLLKRSLGTNMVSLVLKTTDCEYCSSLGGVGTAHFFISNGEN